MIVTPIAVVEHWAYSRSQLVVSRVIGHPSPSQTAHCRWVAVGAAFRLARLIGQHYCQPSVGRCPFVGWSTGAPYETYREISSVTRPPGVATAMTAMFKSADVVAAVAERICRIAVTPLAANHRLCLSNRACDRCPLKPAASS